MRSFIGLIVGILLGAFIGPIAMFVGGMLGFMLSHLADHAPEPPQQPPSANTPTHAMIDELIGYSNEDGCQSNDGGLSSFARNGLLAFEVIGFISPKWEKKLVEWKLGRKL